MKKHLFLLPFLAMGSMALSGCYLDLGFIKFGEPPTKKTEEPEEGGEEEKKKEITIMEEYGNYKLATSIQAGKRYLLGSLRTLDVRDGEVRFFNGNYHVGDDPSDTASYGKRYSWYLGTSVATNGDLSFAAELEAEAAGNGEFYFKVHTTASNPWNNKYVGLFPTKATSRKVLSFALLDTPTSTTFTCVDDVKYKDTGGTQVQSSDTVISKFKYFEKYGPNDTTIKTLGFEFQYTDAGDVEPVAKFFGTEGKYTSFDCKSFESAMDPEVYDLAHLYEAK